MQGIKVLIIDEEPEFTGVLADRLRSWGFLVMEVHGRAEALENQKTFFPRVAVISVRGKESKALPLMNQLRANDAGLRVILLLGKGAAIAGIRGMEQGAADCIPLPLDLGVLIDSIRQVTGSNHSIAIDETDP